MLKKILFGIFRYIAHFNKQTIYIGTKKITKSFNIVHFRLQGAEVGLEALYRLSKKSNENPNVCILLCKSKDTEVVEFALSRNISPTLVEEYETKIIDKNVLR